MLHKLPFTVPWQPIFYMYAWQPFYYFTSPKGNFEKRLNLELWLPNKFFSAILNLFSKGLTTAYFYVFKEYFYLSTYKAFLWNTSQQLLQYDWQVHQVIWPTVYPHQLTSHKVFPGLLVTNQNLHDNHSSLLENTGKSPVRGRTTPNKWPTHTEGHHQDKYDPSHIFGGRWELWPCFTHD